MFDHVEHGVELPTLTRKTTEEGRRYFTPDGSAYPSITTVLSILSKQAIIEWRKRVGEEEANRISRQASGRGTAVHKICEDYIDNVENWKGKHQPSNLFMFNTLKPVLDKKINNIWFQEVYLYSDKLKTAGQVDCIAEFEGELSVIDFKTSRRVKSEDNIQNYFMQISFYAAAFYEMTGIPIKQGVILIAVDDSEPQVFKFNTYDYLEHLVQVRKKYRALHEKTQVHNN
jgi:hypothetical protein